MCKNNLNFLGDCQNVFPCAVPYEKPVRETLCYDYSNTKKSAIIENNKKYMKYMKNKIIIGCIAAIVAAVAAVNITLNSNSNKNLSDLMLANIEILAEEHPSGGSTQVTCYSSINECWIFGCVDRYQCSVTGACPIKRSDGCNDIGYCYP